MPVVVAGGDTAFSAMVYTAPSAGLYTALANQFAAIPQYVNDAQRAFYEGARQSFEAIANSSAARLTKAAVRLIGSPNGDGIRTLSTIGEFQHAPDAMVRWLMANEAARNLFNNQMCEGYGDRYANPHPEGVGETHRDWQIVMDGIIVETDNSWYSTQYMLDLEDDEQLDVFERMRIAESWDMMTHYIKKMGDDPTSKWNASL